MKITKAFPVGLCLAIAALASAGRADKASLTAPSDKLVLHSKSAPEVAVSVWEENGLRRENWPGDAGKPPAGAAELHMRVFPFQEGAVYLVTYPKGTRVPEYAMGDESSYLLSGHVIETANGVAHDMRQGDAAFHPDRLNLALEAVEQSTMVSFHFPPSAAPAVKGAPPAEPAWLSGADIPALPEATWSTDRGVQVARGELEVANAPPGAGKFALRRFDFPRWGIIESEVDKGLTSDWHAPMPPGLLYLAKGRLVIHYKNGTNEEVQSGDVFREPAGNDIRTETPEDLFIVKVVLPEGTKH